MPHRSFRLVLGFLASLFCAFNTHAQTPGTVSQYTLLRGPIAVAGVENDLSGITCALDTGTLYAILNSPTVILALNKDLQVERVIQLEGFDDTEDLCHVDANRFAVVEERRRNICEFDLPTDAVRVDYADAVKALIEKVDYENKGLEGVTYIPARDEFIVVKEKKPMRIYAVARKSLSEASPEILHPWDAEKKSHHLDDLSAVHFDAASGHLLLLSHESKSVTEVTAQGDKVSVLSLTSGHSGLSADIPQAEGITLDKNNHLFIVSEPNLIYEFVKK
ncbi:MAG: SdiA-regulated domain-containing protein [Verrucomicrobia bacterium]|nr:SdiA-regulated domain-containing protein [Verrucomicrobiota bacterium]